MAIAIEFRINVLVGSSLPEIQTQRVDDDTCFVLCPFVHGGDSGSFSRQLFGPSYSLDSAVQSRSNVNIPFIKSLPN